MILGISGKARVGKDTLGNFIIQEFKDVHNRSFKHTAFADVLKLMCQEHFSLSTEQLWGDDKEKMTKYPKPGKTAFSSNPADYWTAREIMQDFGSFYRKIDSNFWVNKLFKDMETDQIKDFVITDTRYINEAEIVKESGGLLVRVNREEVASIHNTSHESETGLDNYPEENYDIIIDNSGSLDDLKLIASEIVRFMLSSEDLQKQGGVYNG